MGLVTIPGKVDRQPAWTNGCVASWCDKGGRPKAGPIIRTLRNIARVYIRLHAQARGAAAPQKHLS